MYETERWRPIAGFPSYEVSDRGRVRNADYDRILTIKPQGYGMSVSMQKNGIRYCRQLSKLVASAFVYQATGDEPDLEYDTPMHLDGDQRNCRADNLIWATRSQAIIHHKKFGNR